MRRACMCQRWVCAQATWSGIGHVSNLYRAHEKTRGGVGGAALLFSMSKSLTCIKLASHALLTRQTVRNASHAVSYLGPANYVVHEENTDQAMRYGFGEESQQLQTEQLQTSSSDGFAARIKSSMPSGPARRVAPFYGISSQSKRRSR